MVMRQVLQPPISVLTVTRRATTLDRCLSSIAQQDFSASIEHVVLVDGDREVYDAWKHMALRSSIQLIPRTADDYDGPKRLAYLRNIAVELAKYEHIVFLDDDNAWSANHLDSLWCSLDSGDYYMAHSHRLMYENDGTPYLRAEFPWKRDRAERERIYRLHVDSGIMTPGSNVVRDYVGMPESCVDLGEWLLRREFLVMHPFASSYSDEDWTAITVEDAKLSSAIIESGLLTICSHLPTLHYYLGGYSNNFSEHAPIRWRRNPYRSEPRDVPE